MGVAQLKKLDKFVARRRENWTYPREQLTQMERYLILPEKEVNTEPSWFGFLITVREERPVSRDELVTHLEIHNIQTRPLFSGNLTRHPCFRALEERKDYRMTSLLSVTDQIMSGSFWVGVYPGMEQAMLDEIVGCIQGRCST